jgi:hypothetical protein
LHCPEEIYPVGGLLDQVELPCKHCHD